MMSNKKIFSIIFITVIFIEANNALNDDKKQDAKCLLPVESGPCRMSLTRFYYNAKTDTCEEFKFGGCKGNDNKFGFRQTCEAACKKPIPATSTSSITEKHVSSAKPTASSTPTPKQIASHATVTTPTSTSKFGATAKLRNN